MASIRKWSFDFEIEKSNFVFKIEDFANMRARDHVKKCESNHSRELNKKNGAIRDSL